MLKGLVAGILGMVAIQAAFAAEPISLNGSTTVMNAILAPKKAEIEKLSGQSITIVGNGSQRGIADLAAGKAQIAMISAPLADEVGKLNKLQPGAIDPAKVHGHQIGETRVAFAVHTGNGVKTLSDAQLTDIMAGKVTNWKEVGGADQAIVIVAAQPGDGVRTMVETTLLKGASLPASTRALSNAGQIVKVVAQIPGGIGVIAATSLDATVAELKNATPITQPLILVTMGEETPAVQQIIEAATKVGKSS